MSCQCWKYPQPHCAQRPRQRKARCQTSAEGLKPGQESRPFDSRVSQMHLHRWRHWVELMLPLVVEDFDMDSPSHGTYPPGMLLVAEGAVGRGLLIPHVCYHHLYQNEASR